MASEEQRCPTSGASMPNSRTLSGPETNVSPSMTRGHGDVLARLAAELCIAVSQPWDVSPELVSDEQPDSDHQGYSQGGDDCLVNASHGLRTAGLLLAPFSLSTRPLHW